MRVIYTLDLIKRKEINSIFDGNSILFIRNILKIILKTIRATVRLTFFLNMDADNILNFHMLVDSNGLYFLYLFHKKVSIIKSNILRLKNYS